LSNWTYSLLALPGFFVGLMLMGRIGRLAQIFAKPVQESDTDSAERSPVTLKLILGTLAIMVGWLAVFGALALYARNWESGATGWMWFFVGMAAAPCVLFPLTLYIWQRQHKRYAEHIAVNRELSADDSKYIYDIEFDETYINTMIDRYLQQAPTIPSNESIPVIAALVFAATWLFDPLETGGVFFATVMVIMVIAAIFFLRSATRKSLYSDLGFASHMRKRSTYTLSIDGLHVSGPRPPTPYPWPDLVEWPELRKGVQFRDGILLLRGPMFVWLPNPALVDANPEDVAHLVNRKSRLRSARYLT
jgi:hypothetical protein